MTQMKFSHTEYAGKRKQTRREIFLAEVDLIVPWGALLTLIEKCPKAGNGHRA